MRGPEKPQTPPAPPIQFPRVPDLRGWKDICARLGGVSEDTAKRYEKIKTDPLPILYDRFGKPRAFSTAIDAWNDRGLIPGTVYRELRALRASTWASTRASVRVGSVGTPKNKPG